MLTDTEREARDREIARLRRDGKSLREISEAVGFSEGCISHVIRRNNLPLKWTNPLKVESDEYVRRRRYEGAAYEKIAEEMNVSPRTVRIRAKKMELPEPPEHIAPAAGRPISPDTIAYTIDHASGLKVSEIADKYGVPHKTVRSAIYRRNRARRVNECFPAKN